MKTIKTILAVSALASVAGAANATYWNVTMAGNTYFAGANGPLIMNFNGTYDDVVGEAVVSGHVSLPGFATELDYKTIILDMPTATGEGFFNPPDSSASNCTGNTASACPGFSQALTGNLYNDINFGVTTDANGNQSDVSTGTPFTINGYMHTWTLAFSVREAGKFKVYQLPFSVCIGGWEGCPPPPTVTPIPTTAWLFGSGLLGLVGAARRRMK